MGGRPTRLVVREPRPHRLFSLVSNHGTLVGSVDWYGEEGVTTPTETSPPFTMVSLGSASSSSGVSDGALPPRVRARADTAASVSRLEPDEAEGDGEGTALLVGDTVPVVPGNVAVGV